MIEALFPFYDEDCFKGDVLSVPESNLKVEELSDGVFLISGDSAFEELPRKFIFDSECLVPAVLVPFCEQCIDGEVRI